MPADDQYQAELTALRAALASGVLTVESNGRRKTYRSAADLEKAIRHFEGLGGGRRLRRSRFRAAAYRSE